jgi:hypothetical protein
MFTGVQARKEYHYSAITAEEWVYERLPEQNAIGQVAYPGLLFAAHILKSDCVTDLFLG